MSGHIAFALAGQPERNQLESGYLRVCSKNFGRERLLAF